MSIKKVIAVIAIIFMTVTLFLTKEQQDWAHCVFIFIGSYTMTTWALNALEIFKPSKDTHSKCTMSDNGLPQ